MTSANTLRRPVAASMATELQLRLASCRKEAEGVLSFELVHPDGLPLPAFEPGAHLLVEAAPGVLRAYSLCNDPAERHRYVIAVLRSGESRGGSVAMHDRMNAGDSIRTSRPRNEFALADDARRSILLGGGIGITPLLAMAERLCATQSDFVLHYCTRDAARTAFADRIQRSPFAASTRIHHDDGADALRFDAEQVLARPECGTHVYVCGPGGFIAHVMSTAQRLGWPAGQLHREYFAPPDALDMSGVTDMPGAPAEAAAKDTAFSLVLASSGRRIAVNADQSAAQALQDAGVPLVMSCEQGICGTCVTTVLEGAPDHRDHYLTEADRQRNDCFMPCCSRALGSQLIVDL
jgi:vanillate O-demethylase ferredoxin subunit